jgi:hypothetical protein
MKSYFYRRQWLALFLVPFLLPGSGCVRQTRVRAPAPPSPAPVVEHKDPLLDHLLGTWQAPEQAASGSRMVFESDGRVIFSGGLAYYNPAQWSLDRGRRELMLTFPQTPNEKLDIFHMNVGDGVKAFDRKQKQATYKWDEETDTLNVAGWMFSKPVRSAPAAPADEPVLK